MHNFFSHAHAKNHNKIAHSRKKYNNSVYIVIFSYFKEITILKKLYFKRTSNYQIPISDYSRIAIYKKKLVDSA